MLTSHGSAKHWMPCSATLNSSNRSLEQTFLPQAWMARQDRPLAQCSAAPVNQRLRVSRGCHNQPVHWDKHFLKRSAAHLEKLRLLRRALVNPTQHPPLALCARLISSTSAPVHPIRTHQVDHSDWTDAHSGDFRPETWQRAEMSPHLNPLCPLSSIQACSLRFKDISHKQGE